MGKFKPGIGALLAGTRIPAVPCRLQGAHAAWPKGKLVPRPRRIRLVMGPPRIYDAVEPGKPGAEHVAEDLREAIRALE